MVTDTRMFFSLLEQQINMLKYIWNGPRIERDGSIDEREKLRL